jgi:hypothetical protein
MDFRFTVVGDGWAKASIADGGQKMDFTISYLCDALRDMLEGMVCLLDGGDFWQMDWYDEPGVWHWEFVPTDGWKIEVGKTYFRGEDLLTTIARPFQVIIQNDPELMRPIKAGDGQQIFRAVFPLKELATQAVQRAGEMLAAYGFYGYRQNTIDLDFPVTQYLMLEQRLRTVAAGFSSVWEFQRRHPLSLRADLQVLGQCLKGDQ